MRNVSTNYRTFGGAQVSNKICHPKAKKKKKEMGEFPGKHRKSADLLKNINSVNAGWREEASKRNLQMHNENTMNGVCEILAVQYWFQEWQRGKKNNLLNEFVQMNSSKGFNIDHKMRKFTKSNKGQEILENNDRQCREGVCHLSLKNISTDR